MNIDRVQMTSQSYQPSGNSNRVLVMHATAGTYPGDYGWLKHGGGIVNGTDVPVSVHYYIDKQGHITQFLDDQVIAWHAGLSTWPVDGHQVAPSVNGVAVGIELENRNTGYDPYPQAQYASAVALARQIVNEHAIPQHQLVRHLDISPGRKTDPAGFPWAAFVAEVYAASPASATPAVLLGTYRVRDHLSDDPADNYAQVRQDRRKDAPEAVDNDGHSIRLAPGTLIDIGDITNGWAWIKTGAGFLALSLLERPVADGGLTFLHAPRISEHEFTWVLARALSPAASEASAMYQRCAAVGVDPAILLAFFQHESGFGLQGICHGYDTKNIGNVRSPFDAAKATIISTSGGSFAKYASWADGTEDWAERIKIRYCDPTNSDLTFAEQLDTVEEATPVYAPTRDGNDPQAYAKAVRANVETWMKEDQA